MPLGEREGWENSCSKYCGLETEFSDDVPSLLSFNIEDGGFDFVLAPLTNPSYRPSDSDSHRPPFAGSDLDLPSFRWKERVIGKISSWIDLDSEDENLRMDSETALEQEVAWANHLCLRACLLPTPKGKSCENYARCVKQILQGNTEIELWLRIPLEKPHGTLMRSSSGHSIWQSDPWNIWNSFRLLCDHDSKLCVALDVGNLEISLGRWFGEPVKAAIISTQCFLSDGQGDPYLSLCYQEQIELYFRHSIQVIISGRSLKDSVDIAEGMQTHPYKLYWNCISNVFDRMKPYSEKELIWLGIRDCLNAPFQPLKDNLDAGRYEIYESDSAKYIQYRKAVAKALTDRVPNEKASELTTVLMVVGAGRGLLVKVSLQAAEETGRMLKVYAVEKNPNAVITLHDLVKRNGWEGTVTVVSCDMRFWDAPERADILVSELLGSFGDNHLSPECLDGAQRFLKPDGISIPSSYTSFIQPITASKLYNDVKCQNVLSYYETAYSVNLHRVASLAPPQRVFTFKHPNLSRKLNNKCYKKLRFVVPVETGSALVHGFAGYFEAILYDKLRICTVPGKATENLFGWFPVYFPLREPVEVYSNDRIEASIWRCSDSKKVWYEWCVSSPTVTQIHNTNGRSYWMSL